MSKPDARLLTLLGHELRAPVGVIGGYLALLDRPGTTLTTEQQQAVSGARRAQQHTLETLEDTRRLVDCWTTAPAQHPPVAVSTILTAAALAASAEGLPLAIAVADGVGPVSGPTDVVARALVAIARAVGKEQGTPMRVIAGPTVDPRPAVRFRVQPESADTVRAVDRVPFEGLRSGLGLALVVAQAAVEGLGGTVSDLRASGVRAGIEFTLPAQTGV